MHLGLMDSSISEPPSKARAETAAPPRDSEYVLDAMNGSRQLEEELKAQEHPQSRGFSFLGWLLGRRQ